MFKYLSMRIFIIFRCVESVTWKLFHKNCTILISCEEKVYGTNKCTKIIQHIWHVLSGLYQINLYHPTKYNNNNHTYVDWYKFITTKGMKNISLHENQIWVYLHINKLEVLYISINLNVSYLFNKKLHSGSHFIALRNSLMCPRPRL